MTTDTGPSFRHLQPRIPPFNTTKAIRKVYIRTAASGLGYELFLPDNCSTALYSQSGSMARTTLIKAGGLDRRSEQERRTLPRHGKPCRLRFLRKGASFVLVFGIHGVGVKLPVTCLRLGAGSNYSHAEGFAIRAVESTEQEQATVEEKERKQRKTTAS